MYPYAPILPNEHLTGYIGRLYTLNARATLLDTVREFGLNSKGIYPHTLYRAISSKLVDMAGIQSIEAALADHTLTQYGLPFLTQNEQEAVKSRRTTSPDYPTIIGHNMIRSNNWRWCDECILSDTEHYGISYYHRDHQIPGVYHCLLHGKKLYDGCPHCNFEAKSLKALPIPPLDNSCPNCKATLEPPVFHFTYQMREIESISLKLCSTPSALTIENITAITFETVGVSNLSNRITASDRKIISQWYQDVIDTSDPRALRQYFTDRPNGADPCILRKRALFATHPKREPLHPLAHLFVLQNRGVDLQALFKL